LRVVITDTPVNTLLRLATSYDGETNGAYDSIIGRVGAGLDLAWFNLGVTSGTPYAIDPGTKILAERNQLLGQILSTTITLHEQTTLGSILNNLLRSVALLLGPLTSGLITARLWARPVLSPITIYGTKDENVDNLSLEPLRVLHFSSGYHLLTLEPEFSRPVILKSSKGRREEETQEIRIWQQGNKIAAHDIQAGDLATVVRGFFEMLGGAPVVYDVEIALRDVFAQGLSFCDFVTYENASVVTAEGLGISGSFLVLGLSVSFQKGIAVLRLLPATFTPPVEEESQGPITPHGRPDQWIHVPGALDVDLVLTSPGNLGDFDATTAHNGSWNDYLTDELFVIVERPIQGANPAGASDLEEVGFFKAWGKVIAIKHLPGLQSSVVRVRFSASQERGGLTVADFGASADYTEEEPRVVFSYHKPDDTHPEGVVIDPPANQLKNGISGRNFLRVIGKKSRLREKSLL
jgi:hypothetical protein